MEKTQVKVIDMNNHDKLNVLITGAGGGGLGEGFLEAIRLSGGNYRTVATDMNPISIGIFEADKGYLVPSANKSDYLEKILDICQKENINVIIPGSEPELMKISENRKLFLDKNILLLINNHEVINLCQDKFKMSNFLLKHGFNVPKSKIINDVNDISWDNEYPVVLKPFTGAGGSRHAYIAQDDEDLEMFSKYMLKYGIIPMVQEYVGTMDDEYTVGVLTSFENGELLGSIAVKRNIHSIMSNRLKIKSKVTGKILGISTGISQGEIDIYPEVLKTTEKIALKLGSKGPLNLQCRMQDGKVYIFEINPRLSGTTPLRALVGYNEIDLMIRRSMFGEDLRAPDYKRGFILRGLRNFYIPYSDVESLKSNSD